MSYNLSGLQNATDWGDIALAANNATSGMLFGGLSIALFFIMLISLKRGGGWGIDESLLASSFSCFILTATLSFGGYLTVYIPLVYLAILAFTGLYVWTTRNY
jgi:hypothetical protein